MRNVLKIFPKDNSKHMWKDEMTGVGIFNAGSMHVGCGWESLSMLKGQKIRKQEAIRKTKKANKKDRINAPFAKRTVFYPPLWKQKEIKGRKKQLSSSLEFQFGSLSSAVRSFFSLVEVSDLVSILIQKSGRRRI